MESSRRRSSVSIPNPSSRTYSERLATIGDETVLLNRRWHTRSRRRYRLWESSARLPCLETDDDVETTATLGYQFDLVLFDLTGQRIRRTRPDEHSQRRFRIFGVQQGHYRRRNVAPFGLFQQIEGKYVLSLEIHDHQLIKSAYDDVVVTVDIVIQVVDVGEESATAW